MIQIPYYIYLTTVSYIGTPSSAYNAAYYHRAISSTNQVPLLQWLHETTNKKKLHISYQTRLKQMQITKIWYDDLHIKIKKNTEILQK